MKYNSERVYLDGRSFASKLEAAIYGHLKILCAAGELADLRCQPHVFLTKARIEMIPDFSVTDLKLGETVFVEAKGFETSDWRIKRRLWTVYGPARLRVYKGSAKYFKIAEEIIPNEHGE